MLHQKPDTFKAESFAPLTAIERKKARQWINGARRAGLMVYPWHGVVTDPNDHVVARCGQDESSARLNFSSANDRFCRSRASRAVDGLRPGIVFAELCREFGVSGDDPEMCQKVNAKLAASPEGKRAKAGMRSAAAEGERT